MFSRRYAKVSDPTPPIAGDTDEISNTSLNLGPVLPYFKIANTVSTSYKVLIIEPSTEWAHNILELKRKTVHDVRLKSLKNLRRDYFPLKQGIFPLGQKISDLTTDGDK